MAFGDAEAFLPPSFGPGFGDRSEVGCERPVGGQDRAIDLEHEGALGLVSGISEQGGDDAGHLGLRVPHGRSLGAGVGSEGVGAGSWSGAGSGMRRRRIWSGIGRVLAGLGRPSSHSSEIWSKR